MPTSSALENHKAIDFLRNIGREPLENRKVIQPEFNGGSSSPCQQNAMLADDGPMMSPQRPHPSVKWLFAVNGLVIAFSNSKSS